MAIGLAIVLMARKPSLTADIVTPQVRVATMCQIGYKLAFANDIHKEGRMDDSALLVIWSLGRRKEASSYNEKDSTRLRLIAEERKSLQK